MFVNASQAHLFYSSGDRGGSQTEKLLLALILASHEDSCNVRDWAVYSLEDVDDYVDGDSWDVPSTWKKNKERNDVVLRFGEYLKVTPAVIDNVRFAAARNDGLGRTDLIFDADKIKRWLYRMLASETLGYALFGPGRKSKSPLRRHYFIPHVARALSDRDTFERLRAALHDGAAAATASTPPTAAPSSDKSAVKRERDQALVERNATQQKYTLVISASRSHKSRNKRRKKNLADCAKRKYEQLHGDEMMKFLQNEKQLKVARVEIRRLTTENSTQRKRLSRFTSNKGGSRMKAHERTAALLRNDIKEKYLKIIRLEDEIAQLSALVKKNQATIDAIWLPTRGRGKGAGRGTGRGGGE